VFTKLCCSRLVAERSHKHPFSCLVSRYFPELEVLPKQVLKIRTRVRRRRSANSVGKRRQTEKPRE